MDDYSSAELETLLRGLDKSPNSIDHQFFRDIVKDTLGRREGKPGVPGVRNIAPSVDIEEIMRLGSSN